MTLLPFITLQRYKKVFYGQTFSKNGKDIIYPVFHLRNFVNGIMVCFFFC